jgi:hypothetical protein
MREFMRNTYQLLDTKLHSTIHLSELMIKSWKNYKIMFLLKSPRIFDITYSFANTLVGTKNVKTLSEIFCLIFIQMMS